LFLTFRLQTKGHVIHGSFANVITTKFGHVVKYYASTSTERGLHVSPCHIAQPTVFAFLFFVFLKKTKVFTFRHKKQKPSLLLQKNKSFYFCYSKHKKQKPSLLLQINRLVKAAALRINLNLDGSTIASKSHTHPSHL
jgi:hypothetical protein